MFKKKQRIEQGSLWVATHELSAPKTLPFYRALDAILSEGVDTSDEHAVNRYERKRKGKKRSDGYPLFCTSSPNSGRRALLFFHDACTNITVVLCPRVIFTQ
jgi:hypothetical protein